MKKTSWFISMSDNIQKFNYENLKKEDKRTPLANQDSFQPGLQGAVKFNGEKEVANGQAGEVSVDKKDLDKFKFTEEDLASSRSQGYEDGYSKGYSAAKTDADEVNKNILENLKIIDEKITQMVQLNYVADVKKDKDVALVVAKIAKKISHNALKNNSTVEIEEVIRRSFELFFDEPRLTIYINNEILGEINKKVDELASAVNFSGEVEIYGREDMPLGSCSIEWKGGGLKVDKQYIIDEIEKMCANIS